MSKWLTQEWLDESTRLAATQPVRPGVSARLQYVVTGGPGGDVETTGSSSTASSSRTSSVRSPIPR